MKHIGRIKQSKKKIAVAYRVIPGDSESCLIVASDSLMAEEHDALMKLIESDSGQQAYELAEAMNRTRLPDGRNMLHSFHKTGKLLRMPTSDIEMTPDVRSTISLDELNRIIAEQKGVSVEDLALQPNRQPTESKQTVDESPKNDVIVEEFDLDTPPEVMQAAQEANKEVLSDEELAAKYRSDADRMYKEAKRLREAAEELVPTKKKTAKKTEESA